MNFTCKEGFFCVIACMDYDFNAYSSDAKKRTLMPSHLSSFPKDFFFSFSKNEIVLSK